MTLKKIQVFILAGVFVLQYIFEHLYPQKKAINNWRNERFNLGIGLFNLIVGLLPAAGFVYCFTLIKNYRLGLLQQFTIPFWMEIIFTVFVFDLWMYVWHRLNHLVPFLWRFHSFHHRDAFMNSTTALRFHIIEILLSYPGKILLCFLMGFQYMPVLLYEILFFISVIIHHSNIKIASRIDQVYRTLFVSPGLHRIHHSIRLEETHSNYGALFSFWDLLFRSRKNKATGEIVFGVENLDTKTDAYF